ncbi:YrzI family small protein [Niallia sp.]|nr:YrzI family small protein [Niallia sp.]
MTLNLIFLTVTLKKKQWTNNEILQEMEMERRIAENRRKLSEIDYLTHRL